jgi:hypothetical protein
MASESLAGDVFAAVHDALTRIGGLMRHFKMRWVCAIVLVGMSGCRGDMAAPARVPASISLTHTATVLEVGQTVNVAAVVRDRDGAPLAGVPLAFTSGDARVAAIDSAGTVTAVGYGTTFVTVMAFPAHDSLPVSVVPVGGAVPAALRLDVDDDRVVVADIGHFEPTAVRFSVQNVGGANLCGIAPVTLRWDAALAAAVLRGRPGEDCAVQIVPRTPGSTWLVVTAGAHADSALLMVKHTRFWWTSWSDSSARKPVGGRVAYYVAVRGEAGPVAGVPVRFAATDGSLASDEVTTGADGIARVAWTMATKPGGLHRLSISATAPDGTRFEREFTETLRVVPDRYIVGYNLGTWEYFPPFNIFQSGFWGCRLTPLFFQTVRAAQSITISATSDRRPGYPGDYFCSSMLTVQAQDEYGNTSDGLILQGGGNWLPWPGGFWSGIGQPFTLQMQVPPYLAPSFVKFNTRPAGQ